MGDWGGRLSLVAAAFYKTGLTRERGMEGTGIQNSGRKKLIYRGVQKRKAQEKRE